MKGVDIVTLLRAADGFDLVSETMNEGADEIERLRAALRELLHETEGLFALVHSDPHQTKTVYPRFILNARAALGEKE